MATLDGTKVAHTQRVDDWCKQVMHSITTTHTLNGHKNDDEEDDIEKKEGKLWKKRDGMVCGMQKGMVLLVIDKVQSGWMVDQLHS